MDIQQLIANILEVTHNVTSKTGKTIERGETFTTNFTVKNITSGCVLSDMKLNIGGTSFARPITNTDIDIGSLGPGQSVKASVEFRATAALPCGINVVNKPGDPKITITDPAEHFANVQMTANLALQKTFQPTIQITSPYNIVR